MSRFTALLLATLATVATIEATQDPKTVCYYESWVHWRNGDGKLDPSELDSSLCTHLVYSYFGIEATTHELKLLDPYLMNDLHDLEKFVNAKGKAQALIAIGGAAMSDQFSITSSNSFFLEKFVVSVVDFLAKNRFDGVIIDWTSMEEKDSENFIKLLDKFDEKFADTAYTLAVSLPATIASYDYYNIPKIVSYADFINVITLDYTGSWAHSVNHASPLQAQLETLEAYHKRGAPRAKMVMAVPMYARTWMLLHPEHQDIGDDASGPGPKGPFTQTPGFLSYNELCTMIMANPNAFSIFRDQQHHAVYAVYQHSGGAEWITFEDSHTLADKAKNITTLGYGGMSVYTLSNEDVHGVCGSKNPLLHAINSNYYRGEVTEAPYTTLAPVIHTTEHVTDIPGVFKCHAVGKYRDPVYCFKYYICTKGDFGNFESVVQYCDRSQAFDNESETCVDRSKVPGC